MDDANRLQSGSSALEGDTEPQDVQLPSLDRGLALLKRHDFDAAIATLEAVYQTTTSRTTRTKATIGLVQAYVQTNQREQAITLCRSLSSTKNAAVQDWAAQTLQDLMHQQDSSDVIPAASQINSDLTGFTPLTAQPNQARQRAIPIPPNSVNQGSAIVSSTDAALSASTGATSTEATSTEPSSPVPLSVLNAATATEASTSATNQQLTPQSIPQSTRSSPSDRPSADESTDVSRSVVWQEAGRAQKWSMLGSVKQHRLWLSQIGTAIALITLTWLAQQTTIDLINSSLRQVVFPIYLGQFAIRTKISIWLIGLLFAGLLAASPWLLDAILQRFYRLKPFSLEQLNAYSPETVRMLKRVCAQRRSPLPTLGIVMVNAPLLLTYGWMPRNARIVVSQGVLQQLQDDEIATLYASEMGHIVHWDFALLSLITLTAQIPYLCYWQIAAWGNRQHDRVLRSISTLISSVSYGLYWLLRWIGLWLSRLRFYYSDRTAAEITGNPNALIRSLLKLSVTTAEDIQRQGQTSFLLESFDLLTPISYRDALSFGSSLAHQSDSALLEWDRSNSQRYWLALNNSHPPLGDRLHLLALYARHWRLSPELDWQPTPTKLPQTNTRRIVMQHAPLLGIPAGLTIALLLWCFGGIATQMGVDVLDWIWGDRSILLGSLLMGFSLGIFVQVNARFPDRRSRQMLTDPDLPNLLAAPAHLPIDSYPIQLRGKLLGRRGLASYLNQDLMVATETGAIRLHYTSRFGPIGNLLPQSPRPQDWIDRPVLVTGWFRRGATPWVDVDTIQTQHGSTIRSEHSILSTCLALLIALLASYVMARGAL